MLPWTPGEVSGGPEMWLVSEPGERTPDPSHPHAASSGAPETRRLQGWVGSRRDRDEQRVPRPTPHARPWPVTAAEGRAATVRVNLYMYLYFVIFIIFGSFFTLNLFIASSSTTSTSRRRR